MQKKSTKVHKLFISIGDFERKLFISRKLKSFLSPVSLQAQWIYDYSVSQWPQRETVKASHSRSQRLKVKIFKYLVRYITLRFVCKKIKVMDSEAHFVKNCRMRHSRKFRNPDIQKSIISWKSFFLNQGKN